MNIIQFGPYPLDVNCIKGGVESSVYGLANALSLDHQVYVFDVPRLGQNDSRGLIGNTQIYRYQNNGRHNQDAVSRLCDIISDMISLYPDVVHIHGTGEISAKVYQALRKKGIKVLLTIHGLQHVEKYNLLRKKFTLKHLYQFVHQSRTELRLIENTHSAIVDTEYVATQLHHLLLQRKIKTLPTMSVVPQGINTEYLSLSSHGSDTKVILSVGAISERKGHLYLIQAFELVCKKDYNTKLIIAGSLADKNYHQMLLDYVSRSPYKNQIQVLVNLPQEQIFQLYQQATLFALHTQEESQGIVFAEAMAVGLPIVSTNVGGVPYVVQDKNTGLLSEYTDIQSFAKNIDAILTNNELYQRLTTNAKKIAQSYDWSNIAKQVLNVYEQL